MALSSVPALPLGNVNTPIFESWAYTQIKSEKFIFTWTIENFSFVNEETGKCMESPEFSVGPTDEYKWVLKMYPKGEAMKYKEFLSVFIYLRKCPKTTAQCKFKFAILNAKKEQINTNFTDEVFQFEMRKGWGYRCFIKRDLLLKESHLYLPKDTLTIICEGSIITDRVNTSGQGNRSTITVSDSADFKNLIFDSDVILEVNGHEIKAHKAILASQSDVFAAMFKHNLEENKSNRVTITDIDHDVLKEMLSFIYTGTVSNLEKIANHLYAAADKYALEKLKDMCEIVLLESLSSETAAETLTLAYLHNSDQMKAKTIDFIKSQITDIKKTKGWLVMLTSYPDLVAEIIESLVKK